jgi:hypothetical protein
MDDLVLRASASRLDGPDYYDVLSDGEVTHEQVQDRLQGH